MADIHTIIPRLWNVEWSRNDLPCNNPCSLMRKDMQTLATNDYLVGAKADGVRAFMIFSFTEEPEFDYTAVVNRTGRGTMLAIDAPLDFYSGTLLDGEMVTDAKGDMTYHVFDIVAISGYTMVNKSHSVRRGEMKRVVTMLTLMNPQMKMKIVEKKWFTLGSVEYSEIVDSILPSPCDGLIFVPEQGRPLAPGRQVDHFKWKTAIHHTVDFIIKDREIFVGDRGAIVPAKLVHVTAYKNPMDIAMDDATVVECKMTKRGDGTSWVAHFLRVRHDKDTANDQRVVLRTLQNIEENILVGELF